MRFFIFYFIFFYFNWPLPPRTSETRNDWKVSTSVFSEIKRDFTRFLSSHVLKFFQNSKLSSFFVVKMKKKNNFKKKKKWKSEFCKIKCAQKNKCGRQLWDTEFFFFSLIMVTLRQCFNLGCLLRDHDICLIWSELRGEIKFIIMPTIWKS